MKKFFIGIFILILLAAGVFFFVENRGSNRISTKFDGFNFISEGKDIDKKEFKRIDGMIYLSLDYIKENIDKEVFYDKSKEELIFNNEHGSKIIKLNEKKAEFNGSDVSLRAPVIEEEGKILVPIEVFIYDYDVDLKYFSKIQLLLLDYKNKEYKIGKIADETLLREEKRANSPIVKKLKQDTSLIIYGESGKYFKVRELEGYSGYVLKSSVDKSSIEEKILKKSNKENISKKPLNITWDYTYAGHSEEKISQINNIKGLDVIIPTWFSIRNTSGDLIDRGSLDYVKKYKDMGIDVWAYLDNSFDPNITHGALKDEATRKKIIKKTLELTKKYGMKGINIDFEHTNIEDRDLITKFTEELAEVFHKENIIVTIDVTPQISSDVTKEPYDRKTLSEICDYVIVMAYDQHWGSSDKAGSVAQYKWVEGSINVLFRNIPNDKMILGIPLYTRLWTESGNKVSSKTISMDEVNRLINSKNLKPIWDEESRQNYIEYSENGKNYKIWIEDRSSIEHKLSLVNKYNLSGVASWRLGFESDDIWSVISKELDSY